MDDLKVNESNDTDTHCGYVAIIGRPNVGKSTLLNRILGTKLSITSRKPQTTRHRILGVKTMSDTQIIYVDTPGLHLKEHHAINRYMNKAARHALRDVDAIIFVVSGLKWTEEDEWVLDLIAKVHKPCIIAVNMVDLVTPKEALLPHLKELEQRSADKHMAEYLKDIVPISARKGTNVDVLQKEIAKWMPESPFFFPEDQITDRSLPFRIAEIIREKIVRILGQELPYTTSVELERFEKGKADQGEKENMFYIHAIIWVERDAQKPIVIGSHGERLKEIGSQARHDIEKLLNTKVHLKLWVRVRSGWTDDERALANLGLIDLE